MMIIVVVVIIMSPLYPTSSLAHLTSHYH